MPKINVNETVTCRNRETGQILTCGAKVFYSLYIEKGFELVTRDNADAGATGPKKSNGAKPKREPASVIGSAAEMAERLNLTGTPPAGTPSPAVTDPAGDEAKDPPPATDPGTGDAGTPATNAEDGAKISQNEDDSNPNGSGVTAERESAKRDRGRG